MLLLPLALIGACTFTPAKVAAQKVSLSAWLVPWNPLSLSNFTVHASELSDGMVEYMTTDKTGKIQVSTDWSSTDFQKLMLAGKQNHVRMFATVTNSDTSGFDAVRMTLLLRNPALVTAAVNALTENAQKAGFSGVDLDYESLVADDRSYFTAFVQKLGANLHSHKMLLSVTVHAKTEEPGTWNGPQAQDWKALAAASDVIRPMCYDYSWDGSAAGPIAPTDWVVQVAKFGISQMPLDKLSIGVAWYGYDWKVKPALSLTFADLPNTPFTLDPASGERLYGSTIHFAASESYQAKVDALRTIGVSKFSAWYCGSGDWKIWTLK